MKNEKIEILEKFLKNLPSISKKNAKKLAIFLSSQKDMVLDLKNILNQIEELSPCQICNNIVNKKICKECENNEEKIVFVLLTYGDLIKLDELNFLSYKTLIVSKDQNFNIANLDILFIKNYLEKTKIKELILFISPTIEGNIISKKIEVLAKQYKIKVSRLRIGIPLGAQIENMDPFTLEQAFNEREKIK